MATYYVTNRKDQMIVIFLEVHGRNLQGEDGNVFGTNEG